MGAFHFELPNDIIRDFERIRGSADKIFGDMVTAGARAVEKRVKKNAPRAIRDSKMMDCLEVTKVYRTPSDGGINSKVGFYGYFDNKHGKRTPAPLVANVFEYGSTRVKKRPFFRKSFNAEEIERAMLEAQKESSGGLLDE